MSNPFICYDQELKTIKPIDTPFPVDGEIIDISQIINETALVYVHVNIVTKDFSFSELMKIVFMFKELTDEEKYLKERIVRSWLAFLLGLNSFFEIVLKNTEQEKHLINSFSSLEDPRSLEAKIHFEMLTCKECYIYFSMMNRSKIERFHEERIRKPIFTESDPINDFGKALYYGISEGEGKFTEKLRGSIKSFAREYCKRGTEPILKRKIKVEGEEVVGSVVIFRSILNGAQELLRCGIRMIVVKALIREVLIFIMNSDIWIAKTLFIKTIKRYRYPIDFSTTVNDIDRRRY